MPTLKYRATITRNSKKKKTPCRKRKVQSVYMDEKKGAVCLYGWKERCSLLIWMKRKVQSVDMDEKKGAVCLYGWKERCSLFIWMKEVLLSLLTSQQQKLTNKNGQPAPKKFKVTQKEAEEIKTQSPPDNLSMLWSYLLVDTRVFNDMKLSAIAQMVL